MQHDFTEFWDVHFKGIAPAGYELRSQLPERWVRFHSLPNSRRYADDAHDYEILLKRANTLASDCLGDGRECWLAASWYDGAHRREKKRWKRDVQAPFDLQPAFKWKLDPDDDEEPQRTVFAGSCAWQPGAYDNLITQIADNTHSHIVLVSQSTGTIFAPYDGGTDLILPSSDAVDAFKGKYATWLSGHAEGL
ncbi:MAG: hypothetical protein HKN11_18135 [Rhizobiales bacterium]|nr:hypothetical protein [Hyphomicrobiales bacterium]